MENSAGILGPFHTRGGLRVDLFLLPYDGSPKFFTVIGDSFSYCLAVTFPSAVETVVYKPFSRTGSAGLAGLSVAAGAAAFGAEVVVLGGCAIRADAANASAPIRNRKHLHLPTAYKA